MALEDFAASLAESVATDPTLTPDRRTFLAEEVRAMRTTIRILARDAPAFVDEVQLLYPIAPCTASVIAYLPTLSPCHPVTLSPVYPPPDTCSPPP